MRFVRQIARVTIPLAAAFVLAAGIVHAQAPPGPLQPRPGVTPQKPPEKPQVRVRVNLVSLPVTVEDAKGELDFELSEQDFRVYDDGAQQKIEHFDLGGDPLAVVFVVETSSRVEPLLPAVRQAGIVFTETVMGATGEAAVVSFDETSNVVVPFTSDHDIVQKAVEKLRGGDSGAHLYDALGRAVALLKDQPLNRRRVVLAVSEAVDTGSEDKLGVVLREAQLANVSIYTIGLSSTAASLRAKPTETAPPEIGPPGTFPYPKTPGIPQTPTTQQQAQGNINLLALAAWIVQRATNVAAEHALAVASVATGGTHLSTFRDRTIQQAMDKIGGELHAQYTLAYRPSGTETYGYHEIKVEVSRPGLKVRTRPGYYLAPPKS